MHPISYFQAIVLGLLQGVSELFPISSLGHAVIAPRLFGWDIHQNDTFFLTFLVAVHLATALVLLGFFWHDWVRIVKGFFRTVRDRGIDPADADARLAWLLIAGTIPAGIIGLALEHPLRKLFASPEYAAVFLIVNGLLLMGGEKLRTQGHRPLSSLSMLDALIIGFWQCTALIPGISRSGATIVGGLLRGIDHEGSAHFSFLIATPIILGATVLEVPKLLHETVPPGTFGLAALAAVIAGVTAFASTAFLMRYFRQHDAWALNPFAYYCFVVGAGSLLLLFAG